VVLYQPSTFLCGLYTTLFRLTFAACNVNILDVFAAMYEHKFHVQGVIWDINSYDQWGSVSVPSSSFLYLIYFYLVVRSSLPVIGAGVII